MEFELGLEWVVFKCHDCNSTSHGIKVEMDEYDTQTISKQISLSGVGKTC